MDHRVEALSWIESEVGAAIFLRGNHDVTVMSQFSETVEKVFARQDWKLAPKLLGSITTSFDWEIVPFTKSKV